MNQTHQPAKKTLAQITLATTTALLLATTSLHAATTRTSAADGDWLTPATWNASNLPDGGNIVIQHALTLNSTTAGVETTFGGTFFLGNTTGPGTLASLAIGSNGTLSNTAGGSLTLARNTIGATQSGQLTLDGGTLSFSTGTIVLGTGANNTNTGTLTINPNSHLSANDLNIGGSTALTTQSGILNINGSNSTLNIGNRILLNANGHLNFTFDAAGISTLNIGAGGANFNLGSTLNINGANYTGSTATFDLLDLSTGTIGGAAIATIVGGLQSDILLNNLLFDSSYLVSLDLLNSNQLLQLTVTAIPEPSSYALLIILALLPLLLIPRLFQHHPKPKPALLPAKRPPLL